MKTYWMTGDVWMEILRHLRTVRMNPVRIRDAELFLQEEYGLVVTGNEDSNGDTYEYEVTDEELLTIFLLTWA